MMASWMSALATHLVPAAQLEVRERRGRLPSGVALLDALTGGGWPRGGLSEIVGGRSSGRTSLLLASVAQALRREEAVALVDVDGAFDPRTAWRSGVPLGRLLWIRCEAARALPAAEVVLAAGGFGLLAVDLGEACLRPPTAAWMRLKRGAAQHGTAVLVLAPRRPAGALGACAVALSTGEPLWGQERLLTGLRARVMVERGGEAGAQERIALVHRPG